MRREKQIINLSNLESKKIQKCVCYSLFCCLLLEEILISLELLYSIFLKHFEYIAICLILTCFQVYFLHLVVQYIKIYRNTIKTDGTDKICRKCMNKVTQKFQCILCHVCNNCVTQFHSITFSICIDNQFKNKAIKNIWLLILRSCVWILIRVYAFIAYRNDNQNRSLFYLSLSINITLNILMIIVMILINQHIRNESLTQTSNQLVEDIEIKHSISPRSIKQNLLKMSTEKQTHEEQIEKNELPKVTKKNTRIIETSPGMVNRQIKILEFMEKKLSNKSGINGIDTEPIPIMVDCQGDSELNLVNQNMLQLQVLNPLTLNNILEKQLQ